MKQNSHQPDELDHILMAMTGHDIKNVVCAMGGMLDAYSQKVNIRFVHDGEAQYIASRVADMRDAVSDMLLCLDEILEALDRESTVVGDIREIMQAVDESNSNVSGNLQGLQQVSATPAMLPGQAWRGAANEEYAGNLPDSPSTIWSM